jgi:hypothetical protein
MRQRHPRQQKDSRQHHLGLRVGLLVLASSLAVSGDSRPGLTSAASGSSGNPTPSARPRSHDANRSEPARSPQGRVTYPYSKLSLSFEDHRQTGSRIEFITRGSGYALFLSPTDALFALRRKKEKQPFLKPSHISPPSPVNVLRMKLVGTNVQSRAVGVAQFPGRGNYFIGPDPQQGRTDIPMYSKVEYRNVYRGIDQIFYGTQHRLEYELIVNPGADPNIITLGFEGADKIEIDQAGNLVLRIGSGQILQRKPIVYQTVEGKRGSIDGKYVTRRANQIGFEIGSYDHDRPLTIDPVLKFSTYLGDTGEDEASGVAVDSAGNTYVVGTTDSLNFPTSAGGLQTVSGGGKDVFVTKLNPSGTAVVYSTYIGGSLDDEGYGIAVDAEGNAYVTGTTASPNFPTTTGALRNFIGGKTDAFVVKLSPTGAALSYSTYLGGSGYEEGFGIAVNASGNAYVTGTTTSTDFSTTSGVMQSILKGPIDAFVTKLSPNGNAATYSTYLGGSAADIGFGIALDAAGDRTSVTGVTDSADFPTTGASFRPTFAGGGDAFVVNLNSAGSAASYATFLGGNSLDAGFGIKLNAEGNAFITGFTESADFPTTAGTRQPISGGGNSDAFVTKLNPAGAALVYSTYLGGNAGDLGLGIALDSGDRAHVTGTTGSSNLSVTPNAIQGSLSGASDAFVTKLNPDGSALAYSSYLGGGQNEEGFGVAVDSDQIAYVAGRTTSSNFPTTAGAFQITSAGGSEAFVNAVPLALAPSLIPAASMLINESCPPNNSAIDPNERVTLNFQLMNNGAASTSNVIATLQTSPGVVAPSGPSIYGSIGMGTTVGRDFSFTAAGTCGGTITATLQLQDGNTNLGSVTFNLPLGVNTGSGFVCATPCGGVRLITTSAVTRINLSTVQAVITVQNIGSDSANNAILTTAKLGTTNGAPLTQPLGNIAPGSAASVVLTFVNSAPGVPSVLTIGGTYLDGAFSASRRLTVP